MKFALRLTGLVFIASVNSFGTHGLSGQSPPLPTPSDNSLSATVTFSDGTSVKTRIKSGRFPLIGVGAGELVGIELRLPPQWAAQQFVVQVLDGGLASSTGMVATDGKTSLQFQAGNRPGLYRVLINAGGMTPTLQFWVPDPSNPSANPPTLKP